MIVPVYHAEAWLRRCVDSLLAQTFRDFELILIDDGSTDGSGAICDEYACQEESGTQTCGGAGVQGCEKSEAIAVRVIHQPNGGVSAARNRGIEAACGEYLAFVDADDWVKPGYLEAFARETAKQPDLVVQGVVNPQKKIESLAATHLSSKEEIDRFLLPFHKSWLDCYPINKLFARRLIEKRQLRFDENVVLGEDYLFCTHYLMACSNLVVVPDANYSYEYNGGDKYSTAAMMSLIDINNRVLDEISPRLSAHDIAAYRSFDFKEALHALFYVYRREPSIQTKRGFLKKVKTEYGSVSLGDILSYQKPYPVIGTVVKLMPVCLSHRVLSFVTSKR